MMRTTPNTLPRRLCAVALMACGVAVSASAATALNGHITLRPLTPQEQTDNSLTNAQLSSGLNTVGIGQPAYLDLLLEKAIPTAEITNLVWTLTSAPVGAKATLAESPLGSLPPYRMIDRVLSQLAGRKVLIPDVAGQYVVSVTVESSTAGSTNFTKTINAGTYMGVATCALCHSGGVVAENTVEPWSKTGHATFFTRAIDGGAGDHYAAYCISCHVVGYDNAPAAVNNGFDDVATQQGWTLPAELTNGNWAALSPELKALSNIQCENCHGPGSEHAFKLGAPDRISKDLSAGDCARCHDSKPYHIRSSEWNNSKHAIAVEETESGCARCHSAQGFANYAAGRPAVATEYEVITCSACHDPHDATNPAQLRKVSPVTLMDKKTVISEGGTGLMCMNCHMSRRDATNYVEVTAGSIRFGPHHGPQADMLAGANAMTYGQVIPSSTHKDVVPNTCSTCHMQEVSPFSAHATHVGGHTFNMSWEGSGTNGPVHMVEACVQCHGEMESFNIVRQDYDGDGVLEGVQTEVKGLLDKLALLLPPVGQPKDMINITTNWTRPQLRAGYNFLFVLEDGSYGIHNLSYAVGVLKASIASLTGDANNDTLPDSWQTQYFGSVNNPNAAPNANPSGDGVPNWLKYSLGLDPTVPGQPFPGGVAWTVGKDLGNSDPNALAIYTAAEIVFNTEVGKTYQIQGVSSLSGGWQNVGAPIPGTGSAISFVAPSRQNASNFYRVMSQ